MKPRNLKQAMENGYTIVGIRSKYSERIEVLLTRRFPLQGKRNNVNFRINRKYFMRKYPNTFEKFTI